VSKPSPNIDLSEEKPFEEASSKEIKVYGNNEISINYVHGWEILDRKKIFINNVFAFKVAFGITRNDDEIEPQIVKKYQHWNN